MPGPVIKMPPLPSWADPKQANEDDPLYKTLLRKAVGVLGIDDPMTSITGMMNPTALAATVVPKLEPFLVQVYKQRLRADPTLYAHPGLQQVPEFMEAFKQLYPGKKIVSGGRWPTKSVGKRLRAASEPPATKSSLYGASSPEEVVAVAQDSISTAQPKTPRTVTYKEMRAARGKQSQSTPQNTKYSTELIQQLLNEFDTWTGTRQDLARKYGVAPGSLNDILIRMGKTQPK